jgi:hypothetical protein
VRDAELLGELLETPTLGSVPDEDQKRGPGAG